MEMATLRLIIRATFLMCRKMLFEVPSLLLLQRHAKCKNQRKLNIDRKSNQMRILRMRNPILGMASRKLKPQFFREPKRHIKL